jgi:hypothetical protein
MRGPSVDNPISFTDLETTADRMPGLSKHTDDVLKATVYSSEQIDEQHAKDIAYGRSNQGGNFCRLGVYFEHVASSERILMTAHATRWNPRP